MVVSMLALLVGCTGTDEISGAGSAAISTNDGARLTRFEERLLGQQLVDVQAGVRPWGDDRSIGVCTKEEGSRSCPQALGREVGELPPGEYQLFAELRVPAIGEKGTWTVEVHTDCTITGKDGATSQRDYDKSYTVTYAGEERGYRLAPLVSITSPSSGRRECTWTLTAPHPDREIVYAGSWSTPAKD